MYNNCHFYYYYLISQYQIAILLFWYDDYMTKNVTYPSVLQILQQADDMYQLQTVKVVFSSRYQAL